MAADQNELAALLDLIEQSIDSQHQQQVDERYLAALNWQPVDRPPLVVQSVFPRFWSLPKPWDRFRRYPYAAAYRDPAAMMQNQLLDRVVPGLLLHDDSPLGIRCDHGTVQIGTQLGAAWDSHKDDYPWVVPIRDGVQLAQLIDNETYFDPSRGVAPFSTAALEFYKTQLDQRPTCRSMIQISLPDLQGPMDIAEQLWGSEIMLAVVDEPQRVMQLMRRIVTLMCEAIEYYNTFARDRLAPQAITQHGYMTPGNLLIRDDSAILVSTQICRDVICPVDGELLEAVGGGAIHFCGNGQHVVEPLLDVAGLRGLDFGQSYMMDMPPIYDACRRRKIAITNVRPGREALMNGDAVKQYPTGVVFVHSAETFDEAQAIVSAHRKCG